MNNRKYVIGMDFGTKSARAALFDAKDGMEIAESVKEYIHGVIDEYLPGNGERLPQGWALQHPGDYLDALSYTVHDILSGTCVDPQDIIGIGIDFTSCTILPIDRNGTPLCMLDKYKHDPHSYVKMWKHHGAQKEAERVNEVAGRRGDEFLMRNGGWISVESLVPKVWSTLNGSPQVYKEAYRFIEAGDWIIMQLTGRECRSVCMTGYHALWDRKNGYPPKDFFRELDPRLENMVEEKLSGDIFNLDQIAGEINTAGSELTGLKAGTAVAVSRTDGHTAVPGSGITEPNKLLLIIGTSTAHMMLDSKEMFIKGITGVSEGGIIPGYYGYLAGQCCVGDLFEWFVKNCLPGTFHNEADERNISIHKVLREKAREQKPGESGLMALDWWNGNRCIINDPDLSGMLIGCTLRTRPEEIYRALVEATAYGSRVIIEAFINQGIDIHDIFAAGGIAAKDEMLMQIYSDIHNMPIKVPDVKNACTLGSAMFATVAAGVNRGGHATIQEASRAMSRPVKRIYKPIAENARIYNRLYAEYKEIHDYFGRTNNIMKRLKGSLQA